MVQNLRFNLRICDSNPYQSAVATSVLINESKSHYRQISRYAIPVHRPIEPTEVDEDRNVRHIKPVADAAIEGQWPAPQQSINRIARPGRCDRRNHRASKTHRQRGIQK